MAIPSERSQSHGQTLISEAEENQEDLKRAWISDIRTNKRCLLAVPLSDRFRAMNLSIYKQHVVVETDRQLYAVTHQGRPCCRFPSLLYRFMSTRLLPASRDRATCYQPPPSLRFPARSNHIFNTVRNQHHVNVEEFVGRATRIPAAKLQRSRRRI